MKLGLVVETNARTMHARDIVDERSIKPPSQGKGCFGLKSGDISWITLARAIEITWHPVKFTRQLLVTHDRVDLLDGCTARIPNCLRVSAAEPLLERRQAHIGHRREMRARVTAVN